MSVRRELAIKHIQAGDKATGKRLLIEALKAQPQDDRAWVWMSAVVDDDELRQECLQEALKWNPRNAHARRGLQKLAQRQKTAPGANGGATTTASLATETWSYEAYRREHPEEPVPTAIWQPKTRAASESPSVLAWLWIGLPLLLMFVGGAIGGAVGGVGASINLGIYRSRMGGVAKFVAMSLVAVGAFVAYVVLAIVLSLALIDAGILR